MYVLTSNKSCFSKSTDIDTEIQIQLHSNGGLTIDITDEESDVLNFGDLDMYSLHEIGIKTFDKGKQLMVKLDCKYTYT